MTPEEKIQLELLVGYGETMKPSLEVFLQKLKDVIYLYSNVPESENKH